MIHGFPVPYPDELFYSVVARRDAQMSYPGYTGVLQELFGRPHLIATMEFPSHLEILQRQLPSSHPCADFKNLEQLTLLPWHVPFLPPERTEQIQAAMMASGGAVTWNRVGITAARIKQTKSLRFCPECLRADKMADRTPYWRKLHQLAGIEVCPEHEVHLEHSDVSRQKRKYRHALPAEELLAVPARPLAATDAPLLSLARRGQQLLSSAWPVLEPAQLCRNYLQLLKRRGYLNVSEHVRLGKLHADIKAFYPIDFLRSLGCAGSNWLVRLVHPHDSSQQPIRHLLLLNFLSGDLDDLLAPANCVAEAPLQPMVKTPANLACANHLCSKHGNPTGKFLRTEQSSMLRGKIDLFQCYECGQLQARCKAGHSRIWIRDYGHLWRKRLAELWATPGVSMRAIAKELRVSCDTVRKYVVKLKLPLKRNGCWRTMSVQAFSHLLVSKQSKRQKKVERLRKKWLEAWQKHPGFGVRALRDLVPSVYATLYRYDREWLKVNQPSTRQPKPKVDWGQRDQLMCQRLKASVDQCDKLTPSRLARCAGVTGWVSDRFARLPKAGKLLRHLAEHPDVSRN